MLLTCGGLVIKMMTQGPLAFLKQPWYMLDMACLLFALMTLMHSSSSRGTCTCSMWPGLLAVGLDDTDDLTDDPP